MNDQVSLSRDQAAAAIAFIEAFNLHTTGVWCAVEAGMRDSFGIADPEAAIDDLLNALQS